MIPRRNGIQIQCNASALPAAAPQASPPGSLEANGSNEANVPAAACRPTGGDLCLRPGGACVQRVYMRCFSEGERTLTYRIRYLASLPALATSAGSNPAGTSAGSNPAGTSAASNPAGTSAGSNQAAVSVSVSGDSVDSVWPPMEPYRTWLDGSFHFHVEQPLRVDLHLLSPLVCAPFFTCLHATLPIAISLTAIILIWFRTLLG